MKALRLAILIIGIMGLLAIPASADPISLGQGQTVTLTYQGVNPGYSGTAVITLTGNTMTITLTNTGSGGSFISAFGMNTTPNMTVGSATFSGGVSGYTVGAGGLGSIEVAFGGSGNPNGLQVGQSGTISFNFTSSPSNPDPLIIDLDLVHFQGLGDSEKLTHIENPEPASVFLMGTGLVGISSLLRKRFAK